VVEGAAPGDQTITIKVPMTWEWVKALLLGLMLISLDRFRQAIQLVQTRIWARERIFKGPEGY
jgi:hypothetical protein